MEINLGSDQEVTVLKGMFQVLSEVRSDADCDSSRRCDIKLAYTQSNNAEEKYESRL